jgi:hypothetical protein
MQETHYRITIGLTSPIYERRQEMLEKIEKMKKDMASRGHTGRYGLNVVVCYSTLLTQASCLASTVHPEGFPWLAEEFTRLKENEEARRHTLEEHVDKELTSFNRMKAENKIKHIEALTPRHLQKFGMTEEDVVVFKELPEEYASRLEHLKKQPMTYSSFMVDQIVIDPVKPTKKELQIEDALLKHLEQVPTELKRYELSLLKQTKSHEE